MCFRDAEGHTPGESARAIAESQLPGAPANSQSRPEAGAGDRRLHGVPPGRSRLDESIELNLERCPAAAGSSMSYKALLVRHDSSAFEGTTEEAFKHHLLHQVTYDTVLKAVKREGHALAANWLAGRVGDRADEYLGVTAEHFERAGDAAKALDYFERAARAAKARFAIHEALAYLARELALPELSAPLRRFRVLDRQAEAADWLGDRSLQEAALIERAALAEAVGDDALRPESLSNRALLADRRGDQVSAAALAMDAVRLAEQVGLAHVASVAHGELAWVTRRSPRVTTPRALALTRQMGWRDRKSVV